LERVACEYQPANPTTALIKFKLEYLRIEAKILST
jgi:hypothetical protein